MLKIRVTFVDDEEGRKELKDFQKRIENESKISNISKIYNGRGITKYSNVYFEVEGR